MTAFPNFYSSWFSFKWIYNVSTVKRKFSNAFLHRVYIRVMTTLTLQKASFIQLVIASSIRTLSGLYHQTLILPVLEGLMESSNTQ